MGKKALTYSLRDSQVVYPNFGTVVWFEKAKGFFTTTIGDWQIQHPKFKVFIAYGVTAYWSKTDNKISELIHGNAIGIKSPDNICRYYHYPAICEKYSKFLMPLQAILDWDKDKQSECLHFDDLYWFYPDYRDPVSAYKQMGKVELISAIVRRLELAKANSLRFDAKPVKPKSPIIKTSTRNAANAAMGKKGWGPSDPTWWTYQPPF